MPDLEPDSLVGVLTADTPEPDLVAVAGYVGQTPDGDVRLFLDPECHVWFDIPTEHVVHRKRIPGEYGQFGDWSMLWVSGEWMNRPMFDQQRREELAEAFLIGEYALEIILAETVAQALEEAADYVRRTTMHTRHCPKSPTHPGVAGSAPVQLG